MRGPTQLESRTMKHNAALLGAMLAMGDRHSLTRGEEFTFTLQPTRSWGYLAPISKANSGPKHFGKQLVRSHKYRTMKRKRKAQ